MGSEGRGRMWRCAASENYLGETVLLSASGDFSSMGCNTFVLTMRIYIYVYIKREIDRSSSMKRE